MFIHILLRPGILILLEVLDMGVFSVFLFFFAKKYVCKHYFYYVDIKIYLLIKSVKRENKCTHAKTLQIISLIFVSLPQNYLALNPGYGSFMNISCHVDIKVHLYGIVTCIFIMVFMKKKQTKTVQYLKLFWSHFYIFSYRNGILLFSMHRKFLFIFTRSLSFEK